MYISEKDAAQIFLLPVPFLGNLIVRVPELSVFYVELILLM